jgi:hypothetical protein
MGRKPRVVTTPHRGGVWNLIWQVEGPGEPPGSPIFWLHHFLNFTYLTCKPASMGSTTYSGRLEAGAAGSYFPVWLWLSPFSSLGQSLHLKKF